MCAASSLNLSYGFTVEPCNQYFRKTNSTFDELYKAVRAQVEPAACCRRRPVPANKHFAAAHKLK